MKICQTILNKLAQDYIDQDRRLKISVSIGITKYSGEKLNADQLLFNASLALKSVNGTITHAFVSTTTYSAINTIGVHKSSKLCVVN